MLVQEMTRQESLELLARAHLGRLACTQGGRPYVVPVYFASDHDYLYSFSTVGQKIEWMRANPLVCVEVDEVVSPEQWVSVVVFGRYEELADTPEWQGAHPAGQELAKRPGDELRQAGPVGPVGSGAQELIQVLPTDPVEHARLRVARLIASPDTAHASP